MWFKLKLNVNALLIGVGVLAVIVGFVGGVQREKSDWPYPLYVATTMVVTFAIFVVLVPLARREYTVAINPTQGRVRIGRREFPASEVTEVQGMVATSSSSNSQVDYVLFVKDPTRGKPYRGKFTIKLPYVKARTAAEFEAILQIIPQFSIPEELEAPIVTKRNRSFQRVGKNELTRVTKFELQAQYPVEVTRKP